MPRSERDALDAALSSAATRDAGLTPPPDPTLPAYVPGWGPPLRCEWCVWASHPTEEENDADAATSPDGWRRGCRVYGGWSPADGVRLATVVDPDD